MNKKPGIGVGVGIVVVAIVAVAMFAGCIEEITETPTAPSFDAELTQKLQTALDSAVNEFKVPGAVMVVRSPNGATWTGTSGLANLEDEAPMGSDMHLRIGSVTKTYTATVILQLVDEGLLRLDGTIEEKLPDIDVVKGDEITIRQLLEMRSGLGGYDKNETWGEQFSKDPRRVWSPSELIEYSNWTQFEPDERFDYNNANYILLGMIIEKVTGRTYQEEVTSRIIEPLGLTNTVVPTNTDMPTPYAHGYLYENGTVIDMTFALDPSCAWSAGGIISTAADQLVWIDALVSGKLLSTATQAERFKMKEGTSPHGTSISYGLGVLDINGAIGHGGNYNGLYTAMICRYEDFDFVVLSNGQDKGGTMNSTAENVFWKVVEDIGLYAFDTGKTPSGLGSISGEISCTGSQSGNIYVLALKAENKWKIREMETEPYPFHSQYVYRYTILEGPGFYRIPELEEGEYVLWAWADVNGDGGVNHLKYAEPSGWYQTDEHLLLAKVPVGAGQAVTDIDMRLLSPTPYPEENRSVTRGQGGGTLKTIKNNKVLHLWGTPEERGYAYGYLVGPQIVDWVEYVLVENFAGSVTFYEQEFLPYMRQHFSGNEPYYPEIDAILEGMNDSGTDMYIDLLNRNITRDDIEADYCFMLYYIIYGAFRTPPGECPTSCSSAVVWGNWTRNSELEGGLIHGKNMDGEVDLRKVTVNSLLIIAHEPAAGSGLKKIVSIDWPGFVGTFNAMNEDGLILVPHSSPSIPDWNATNMLDYASLFRETLQQCSTITDVKNFWESATTTRTGGQNTAVSVPYPPGQEVFPSVTYETDSYGGVTREPGDIDPADPYCILTTNNFFKYTGVKPEAVSKVHGYHPEIMPDNYRYKAMMERLDQFRGEGRTVGTTEMIELLRAASTSEEYSGITEYSFIGNPNKMSFALAREDLDRKILDAPFAEFTEFTFDDVFQ